jgi:hypothetical protein
MKVLTYLKNEFNVSAKELADFKKGLSPEEWNAMKEDARKDAEKKGIELEMEPKDMNVLNDLIQRFGKDL